MSKKRPDIFVEEFRQGIYPTPMSDNDQLARPSHLLLTGKKQSETDSTV